MGIECIALSLLAMGAAPTPVILDTDIGGDIDDTWALVMLLGRPELDLKLIVTAVDDTEAKTRLTAKILERMGRTDIPIGTGVKQGDRKLNQADWIEGYDLSAYPGTVHADGVQALIDAIRSSEGPITLIALGPVTNIGEALRRAPDIAEKARVVAMAGSVYTGYGSRPDPDPEYNVKRDVDAFRALLAAPWEVTITPLDGCGDMILRGERYARVRDAENAGAKAVMENYAIWDNRHHHPEDASSVLFDTVAIYLAFDESLCEMETVPLSVRDDGMTTPDPEGKPVRCQIGWKDRAAYEELLVRSIVDPPNAARND